MPPASADPEVQAAAEVLSPTTPDDRVLRATHVVSIVIVPFLLLAWAVLYPWPSDTGRLFAWSIASPLSAMVLGSAYLGGAYFFVRAARSTQWHTIKAGFPPVGLFATLMGIATLLHWDKFSHAHLAFWLWVLLYFTTPFLIAWVWWRNRTHDAPATADDLQLPGLAAGVIAAVGGLALVTGLFLFVAPATAVSIWPWPLTPLTARVMGAVFCLGSAGLGAARERRWSSARIPVQVALAMLVLLVVAGGRARASLDPSRPLTWLFVVGFVGLTVATLALYVRMGAAFAMTGLETVLERMAGGLAELDGDVRLYFHATYLRTTVAVADEIASGGFADPDWVTRWDVVFAELYLDALAADRAGRAVSGPWQVAFGASPDLPPLRHVLLGLNAHINYDLPQALLGVITSAEFDDADLIGRRSADHLHLDRVLQARVGAEDDELSAVSRVTTLDRVLRPANRAASRRFLAEARAKVWRNAVVLDRARRDGRYEIVLAQLESLCAQRVRDLLSSGQVLITLARKGFGVALPGG